MPRSRRITLTGHPYHVTQRGNRKANVFLDDIDRRTYMEMLVKQCIKHSLRIWAYCLMDNHVHLIVVTERENSLSRAFQGVHGGYGIYFNFRHSKTGHLWQGRFKAAVLDERHLWNAVRYVERNPVRAGIVRQAENYQWSSAPAHCRLKTDLALSNDLQLIQEIPNWQIWLDEEQSDVELNFIRERTDSGRPCADDDFVRALEIQYGQRLLPQKAGRKKNVTK